MRRALHAPHLRACSIPRTPDLALALACANDLSATPCLLRRQRPAPRRFQRSPSCRWSLDLNFVSEELVFKVDIDAMLVNGAERRVLGRGVFQSSLPMSAALTFASW